MQTLGLPKDAAHCYPLPNDWVQLLELLNKVWDLGFALASVVFGWCVGIAASGLVSSGLPCCRLDVVIRCRLTRQFVVMSNHLKTDNSETFP